MMVFNMPSDVEQLADEMRAIIDMSNDDDIVCVLEKVWAFKGNGISSTWKFAEQYGSIIGVLSTLKIPYRLVAPQRWMRYYGAMPKDKTERKRYIKDLAAQRYPDYDRRITIKQSDAIMIATYAREKHVPR
tara:strand:+ start:592 stop:984 length:393 start_codon:yes stop_codon:yes gene_type:complete